MLGAAPLAGLAIGKPSADIKGPRMIGIPVCSCGSHMMVVEDGLVICTNNYANCPNFGKKFKIPVIPLEPIDA
jgi:hypothetical protein